PPRAISSITAAPRSWLRPCTITSAPRAATRNATSLPRPSVDPVTRTVLPSSDAGSCAHAGRVAHTSTRMPTTPAHTCRFMAILLVHEILLHISHAVGGTLEGIDGEVTALLHEEVLHARHGRVRPDRRVVDRAVAKLGVVPADLVHVLDVPHLVA